MSRDLEKPNSTSRRQLAAEWAIAAALFVAAFSVAAWYVPQYVASGGRPWFYQQEFGAAVMSACGFGYTNPDAATQPALQAFLQREADAVSCDGLAGVATKPLTSMQRAFRYLIATVATTWWLQGRVAWSALLPLYGFLYGLTIVLAFAVFRQGMGRVLATLASVALIFSTLHLNNLPHLRDYGKAPFVLALVLIAIRLVRTRMSGRQTLGWALGAGLLTGIGIGFRNDLLVAIPAVAGVLALFTPGGLRARLGMRIASVAVYGLAVYVAMWPMSSIYTTGGGSSSQHLVLLGLTPAFSRDLGVDNSGLYSVGFEYRDELALAMIDNYADRKLGQHRFLRMYGADYDRAASSLLTDFARTFPADLLARVYASAARITELPHSTTTAALVVPEFLSPRMQHLLQIKADWLRQFGAIWPWPLAITLIALSIANVRLGLFAAFFVFYLSGYPALQFQERHFFHLEFIGWWALGFALAMAGRAIIAATSRERRTAWLAAVRPEHGWARGVAMAATLWIVLATVLVTPLWALRERQEETAGQLLQAIASSPRTELTMTPVTTATGAVRFGNDDLVKALPSDPGVHAAYLVADIGGAQCDSTQVDLTQRYRAATVPYDFTHAVRVPVPVVDTPVRIVFPAYYKDPASTDPFDEGFAFAGLELSPGEAPCLLRVSSLQQPGSLPILLDLQLGPDWQKVTPYATITGLEGRHNPARLYTFPSTLRRGVVRAALAAPAGPFLPADIYKAAPTFRMNGAEWRVAGVGGVDGRGPLMYLVEMAPKRMAKGALFVAEGTIEKGAVTFGLVRDGQWVVQLHVPQTGEFSVVIEVPEDGDYKLIMANNLAGMSLENHVLVRRSGMVAPAAGGRQ